MRGILSLCRARAPRAVLKFKITFEREAKVTSANAGGDLNSHPFHDRTATIHHHAVGRDQGESGFAYSFQL